MLTVVALALLCESDALHAGRVSGPKVEPWRQLIQDRRLRSRRSSLVSCSVPASSGGETLYKPLRSLLLAAGIQEELDEVTEMSAGFCNWVYKVDLPTPPHSVVVKLFSPLAELRLDPSVRGLGDQLAGEHGLGPRVLYRSREGLITTFVDGQTLEESDIHAAGSRLPRAIARRLADLHSLTPSEHKSDGRAVLWHFLDCMLEHTDQTSMPPSISLSEVRCGGRRSPGLRAAAAPCCRRKCTCLCHAYARSARMSIQRACLCSAHVHSVLVRCICQHAP